MWSIFAAKAGFFSPIRSFAAIAKSAETQVASPVSMASVANSTRPGWLMVF